MHAQIFTQLKSRQVIVTTKSNFKICLKRSRDVSMIFLDIDPGWFHRRQPPPSEGLPVSEAQVSDKKFLSLLSPVTPVVPLRRTAAVGATPSRSTSMDY